jgi:mono/diheme cytochrome c family protein
VGLIRIAVALPLMFGASAVAAADAERGRRIAEKWCARCHVIGAEKPAGGIDSSPSFFVMQEKLEAYRDRVLSFDQRRPHRALDFDVDDAARDDLISYISTLARPSR